MSNNDNKYPAADEFDLGIRSVEDGMCTADAGLPFLLRIPSKDFADKPVKGSYRGFGTEPDYVGKPLLERMQLEIGRLNDFIKETNRFNVRLVSDDGKIARLTDDEWPMFSFSTNLEMLSPGQRLILQSGGVLQMQSVSASIDPSKFTSGFKIMVKRIFAEPPVKGGRYEAIVTGYYDVVGDRKAVVVEVRGFLGMIYARSLFAEHRADPVTTLPVGSRLYVECVSDIRTAGNIRLFFKECLPEAEELDQFIRVIRPGDVLNARINRYDEKTSTLLIDFAGRVEVTAYTLPGLNVRSYAGSHIWYEGAPVKVKVGKVPSNIRGSYEVTALEPAGDVFGLEPGTVVDLKVGMYHMSFKHGGRDYNLYAVDSKTPYLNEWLAEICGDGEISVKGVVISKNNLIGPKISVNSLNLIDSLVDENKQLTATFVRIYNVNGRSFYLFDSDGYLFRLIDSNFDDTYPALYRPEPGDRVRFQVKKSKTVIFKPLYDREETEYALPPGVYHGRVTDGYVNHRYVVDTPAGLVTATVEDTYPEYIIRHFVETVKDVTVTVDDSGRAVLTVDGISFDRPKVDGPVSVNVVCRRGFGLLVRYDGAYGLLPADYIKLGNCEGIDIDSYVRQYADRPLQVYMNDAPDQKQHGLYFSVFDPVSNPYLSLTLKVGDEVDVRVLGPTPKRNLLVEVCGVTGTILKKDAGHFNTAGEKPARCEGETLRAVVDSITLPTGKIFLKARHMADEKHSPWNDTFRHGRYYDIEVVGYIGDEVVVRGDGFTGSLFNNSDLVQRISVNRQLYPVGMKLNALLKKVKRYCYLAFSSTESLTDRIKNGEIKINRTYKATVLCHTAAGVTFAVNGLPVLMTTRAALEGCGPADSPAACYPVGSTHEVRVAMIDMPDRGVYVVRPDSQMADCIGTRASGVVKSLSWSDRMYTVELDSGVTVEMPLQLATWDSSLADMLTVGQRYEFAIIDFDYRKHMPVISRRDCMPNHWLGIKDAPPFVTARVAGYVKGMAIVDIGKVRQTLIYPLGATLALRPWAEDKSIGPDDFKIGTELRLSIAGIDKAKHSYIVFPDYRDVLCELRGKTVDAVIEYVDDTGFWVSCETNCAGRQVAFVPVAEISHARIGSPVGFFEVGDREKLSDCSIDKVTRQLRLSRKALISRSPSDKLLNGYADVTVRGISGDKVLAFVDGYETVLPVSLFDTAPSKGSVHRIHRRKLSNRL